MKTEGTWKADRRKANFKHGQKRGISSLNSREIGKFSEDMDGQVKPNFKSVAAIDSTPKVGYEKSNGCLF